MRRCYLGPSNRRVFQSGIRLSSGSLHKIPHRPYDVGGPREDGRLENSARWHANVRCSQAPDEKRDTEIHLAEPEGNFPSEAPRTHSLMNDEDAAANVQSKLFQGALVQRIQPAKIEDRGFDADLREFLCSRQCAGYHGTPANNPDVLA